MLWKYRLAPSTENKVKYETNAKRLRAINRKTYIPQNNYINSLLNKCKATWKLIINCKLVHPKKKFLLIKDKGKSVTTPQIIAECFDIYFMGKIKSSVEDIQSFKNTFVIIH